jgi:hypothetical protein
LRLMSSFRRKTASNLVRLTDQIGRVYSHQLKLRLSLTQAAKD